MSTLYFSDDFVNFGAKHGFTRHDRFNLTVESADIYVFSFVFLLHIGADGKIVSLGFDFATGDNFGKVFAVLSADKGIKNFSIFASVSLLELVAFTYSAEASMNRTELSFCSFSAP